MLKLAQLCDCLTPTTLAQIVNDVDATKELGNASSDLNLDEVRSVVADALNANVGEREAAMLIERARRS